MNVLRALKKAAAAFFIFIAAASAVSAQQRKVSLDYDARFQYYFNNSEFAVQDDRFVPSGTLHAARLTPSIGVKVSEGRLTHRLMLGVDVMKNMGESPVSSGDTGLENLDLFREVTFWYGIDANSRRGGRFSAYAGIFPRRFSAFGTSYPSGASVGSDLPYSLSAQSQNVSDLFISNSNRFLDNNIEGLLLKYEAKQGGYAELGLDWKGMIGSGRREQFQVFSHGAFPVMKSLYLGWTGSLTHYANSLECVGVVDNITVSPFVASGFSKRDFGLSARLAYVAGLHQDRARDTGLKHFGGGLLNLNLGWKSLGLCNDSYYGTSQMPFYSYVDAAGNIYGSNLYAGNPFYRIAEEAYGDDFVSDHWDEAGFYDRLEVYYAPSITSFLKVRISAAAHFTDYGFSGWQQKISLVFSLSDAMKPAAKKSNKSRAAERREFRFFL